MRRVTIAEARDQLPSLVHDVESGTAIELTRHGHRVAVLLSADAYDEVRRGRGGFAAACRLFRQHHGATLLEDSDWDADALRDRTRGRPRRATR